MTAIHPHAEQILRAAALMESRAAAATAGPWLPSTVWSPRSSVTSGVYSHAHPAGSAASEVAASGKRGRGCGGITRHGGAINHMGTRPA